MFDPEMTSQSGVDPGSSDCRDPECLLSLLFTPAKRFHEGLGGQELYHRRPLAGLRGVFIRTFVEHNEDKAHEDGRLSLGQN